GWACWKLSSYGICMAGARWRPKPPKKFEKKSCACADGASAATASTAAVPITQCLLLRTAITSSSVHSRRQHHRLPARRQRSHGRTRRTARLQWRALRQHYDLGADINAAEQVGHVFIGQANAARRDELADGRGIVGAVNAVLAGAEIHCAGA